MVEGQSQHFRSLLVGKLESWRFAALIAGAITPVVDTVEALRSPFKEVSELQRKYALDRAHRELRALNEGREILEALLVNAAISQSVSKRAVERFSNSVRAEIRGHARARSTLWPAYCYAVFLVATLVVPLFVFVPRRVGVDHFRVPKTDVSVPTPDALIPIVAVIVLVLELFLAVSFGAKYSRLRSRVSKAVIATIPATFLIYIAYSAGLPPGSFPLLTSRIFGLQVLVALLGSFSFFVIVATAMLYAAGLTFDGIMRRTEKASNSPSVANSKILEAIRRLRSADSFSSPVAKKLTIKALYEASELMEGRIPHALGSLDSKAGSILRARCQAASETLREYVVWVTLPREDTRENLTTQLESIAISLALGNFDELPGRVSEESESRRSSIHRMLRILRTIAIGVIPMLLLICSNFIGLSIDDALIKSSAVVFAIAWVVVTFISEFDHEYTSRLDTVRELVSILKPGSKDEKK